MDILSRIWSWIANLFFTKIPVPPPQPQGQLPPPVTRKVLLIVFDPIVPGLANQRLSQWLNWFDVNSLTAEYIQDLQTCSHGYLNYQIIENILVDAFPQKTDGFVYDVNEYLQAWQSQTGFHQPDLADYATILSDFNIVNKINTGMADEVWLFGMPYAGFYESVMAGAGAFFVNAPPLNIPGVQRSFIVMGFNYQRGVGEMLEAFGHRAEFILARAFRNTTGSANLWQRYTRYDQRYPGLAECGTVHFAPNSQSDYDWGNLTYVPSRSRNWNKFPDLSDPPVMLNSEEWGKGDIRLHHTWWLSLFPHWVGRTDGVAWNWWQYVVDPAQI
ncbi:MAG: hypothetical protein ROW48_02295 [Bellilinea sp.]|jgi:hypothetical protein